MLYSNREDRRVMSIVIIRLLTCISIALAFNNMKLQGKVLKRDLIIEDAKELVQLLVHLNVDMIVDRERINSIMNSLNDELNESEEIH